MRPCMCCTWSKTWRLVLTLSRGCRWTLESCKPLLSRMLAPTSRRSSRSRTARRCAVALEIAVSAWPGQAILDYARDARINLLIVGTHGRKGLARLFMGSVAQQVARTAECPVLTVRAHERDFVYPDALQTVERPACAVVRH